MRLYSIFFISITLMFYIFALSKAERKARKIWIGFILAYLPVWVYVLR